MLDTFARASVDGAIFVAVIWAVSRGMPALPAGAKAFLWWCVAAKFVVALVWTTPVFLPVLPAGPVHTPSAATQGREIHTTQLPSREGIEGTTRAGAMSWAPLILGAWGFGCAVLACRGLGRWRRIRRVVRRSSQAPAHIQVMASDLAADLALRRLPDVRISNDVVTPLVTGLRRPVIVLPSDRFNALSDPQQRMTICHELVHLKRSDLWLGCVPALAERLFFFHPLVHLTVREYLFWREAACDAAVLETLDVAPQEYGGLLLDLGVVRPRNSLAAAGAPWSFSILKRRIVMLRDPSSRSLASRTLAPVVVVVALAAIAPLQLSARPSRDAAPAFAGIAREPAADDGQRARTETSEDRLNFVLFFDENRTTMSRSVPRDIDRAKKHRRPGEPMLWFRMTGREYVVRDPTVLRDIERVWEGPSSVGDEQGKVGEKQGAIGAKQGDLGHRQSRVGAEQSVIGSKQATIGTRQGRLAARESSRSLSDAQKNDIETERRDLDRQMKELDSEMRKLDERMRELDDPMRELDEEMRVLDKEMSVLDRRMEEAVKRAEEVMRGILKRAISSGVAETLR